MARPLCIFCSYFIADAFQNVPNPCTSNVEQKVYFPHPTDASKFIQCDKFGRMYIIQCPLNLLYNPATAVCQAQAPIVTTHAPSVVNPVNPANPCTPENLVAGNIYFAVTGDETRFIECDLLGHANVLMCPSGLVWNESRLSCVYKFATSGTGTGTGNITIKPSSSTINGLKNPCTRETIAALKLFFPHPDATKFIQCDLWGDVYVVSCPAGLVWNQYSETCASAFVNVGSPSGRK
ncbi:hypothetical protein CHS0354_004849 [Potamilus streckersoni]|uniref:Chitin-binding type-2 domain-containing protein n=1 Tax=Potamilus streckersoni TaxID=2493646 RepID=A0AAE0SA05_9BIVA|nr:hypothetical protein CHS0354_004849 [Potamilus streckersoni]